MDATTTKPCLKVVGLHIEGLRALRRVDWPADGLGWQGQVPDMVMVGGVNGSGKTTLLEFICDAVRMFQVKRPVMSASSPTVNAWIDIHLACEEIGSSEYRLLVGEAAFINQNKTSQSLSFIRGAPAGYGLGGEGKGLFELESIANDPAAFSRSSLPGLIYLPTDRKLDIPQEIFKAAGKLEIPAEFFHRFHPPENWKESLEALLYSARWEDLNAKEEGRPEDARHFESYAKAFEAFFGKTKSLVWERGELFVKIADTGALHPLMELSSGEKQALILAAELYRRWKPGSLILIDEPELHFHPTWQTTLWKMLTEWQKERGGQVIVATQSNHLFQIGEPGTKVLLGVEGLR